MNKLRQHTAMKELLEELRERRLRRRAIRIVFALSLARIVRGGVDRGVWVPATHIRR
jgi:hypothetical protein